MNNENISSYGPLQVKTTSKEVKELSRNFYDAQNQLEKEFSYSMDGGNTFVPLKEFNGKKVTGLTVHPKGFGIYVAEDTFFMKLDGSIMKVGDWDEHRVWEGL